MKVVIVTGTPGTGKTTVAKKISKSTGFRYIDVNQIIKAHNLEEGFDKKKKCSIVDTKKLNPLLVNEIKRCKKEKCAEIVIDSHLAQYLPKKYVDLCIVTKCNLKVLKKRLEKRGYSKAKIRENLDCEIFDVCLHEAEEAGYKIVVIDTSIEIRIQINAALN